MNNTTGDMINDLNDETTNNREADRPSGGRDGGLDAVEFGMMEAALADADGTAALVFADWLDEQGDDRGEMLRLAIGLRRAPSPAAFERLSWLCRQRGMPLDETSRSRSPNCSRCGPSATAG